MRDDDFRRRQHAGRYAPHVRDINQLVDALNEEGDGPVPHVAPRHGGSGARVLSVLRDPGPMAAGIDGSNFLCVENDDTTAERQALAFEAVGVTAGDVTPWNAYPWFVDRAPNARELESGVTVLLRLLPLLPRIEVLLLQGAHAQDAWRRLLRRSPAVEHHDLVVIGTYHPSRQALFARDPAVRRARQEHRDDAYRRLAGALG